MCGECLRNWFACALLLGVRRVVASRLYWIGSAEWCMHVCAVQEHKFAIHHDIYSIYMQASGCRIQKPVTIFLFFFLVLLLLMFVYICVRDVHCVCVEPFFFYSLEESLRCVCVFGYTNKTVPWHLTGLPVLRSCWHGRSWIHDWNKHCLRNIQVNL